jgi:peroxiredoxin
LKASQRNSESIRKTINSDCHFVPRKKSTMNHTQQSTRVASTIFGLLVCACAGATPAPASSAEPQVTSAEKTASMPAAAPSATPEAAPTMVLGETPASKLGSVQNGLGLKLGAKAPDATLNDVTGKTQKLSALYSEGPTFVVFYRGGWCPFCNLQLQGLTAAKADFEAKGLKVVAISVDKPDEEAKTKAKHGVSFPMLSDSDLTAHKAFNVVHVPPEAEQKALAGYGINLENSSGKTHHSFAVPAIFLIDKSGTVKWMHIDEEYKTRPSAKQMIEVAGQVLKK